MIPLAQAWYAQQREQDQARVRAHAAGLHWFLQRGDLPLPESWRSGLQAAALAFRLDAAMADAAARHLVASLGGDPARFVASAGRAA